MLRLLPLLLLLAWANVARAGEPCLHIVVLVTGEPASCDGVGMSALEYARTLRVEDDLKRRDIELAAATRKADEAAAAAANVLGECAELLALQTDGRRACELSRAPPPIAHAPAPRAYEKVSFWLGAAVVVTAITVGVVAGEHPLLWAAGGLGVGIVIGGEI